ncbi:MAG: glycosyltransferase family 2 protein [Eubacterium sp.]|nr:glycosyltransferase family 2 protein [Eubacterium sp.]
MLTTITEIMNAIIIAALIICFSYQAIFLFAPFVKKHYFKKKDGTETFTIEKKHRYGVLIAARNEEAVIANLIHSIQEQTYNKNLVDIFVVADNCTDRTAEVARFAGANVYERFDKELVGKGYALKYLLDQLMQMERWCEYDGFFIFDADNLLEKDFIEEMNHTFGQGYPVVTSYRNSTNFGDNWISSGYAIWFLHEAQWLNRGRMAVGSNCMVQGTGYMVSREVLEKNDGWKFFLLTEDIEFTADCMLHDIRIGYCEKAMFYDEQPTRFKDSWNQRIRWIKGYFQVFKKYRKQLVRGVLRNECAEDEAKSGTSVIKKERQIRRRRLSCYDMLMAQLPAFVVTAFASAVSILLLIIGIATAQDVAFVIRTIVEFLIKIYAAMFLLAIYTVFTEWKHIHMPIVKKIGYIVTFPIYMYTYVPISFAALKKKVEWKPIAHKASSMEQIKTAAATKKKLPDNRSKRIPLEVSFSFYRK